MVETRKSITIRLGSQTLGKYLRAHRLKVGLSQARVAKKLGYKTAQFVSNWERGLSEPPISTLREIADIYGVPRDEIFSFVLNIAIQKTIEDFKRKFYKNLKRKECL